MNDRELLELAAKAVGVSGVNYYRDRKDWAWNPLDDDGAALRLAISLNLQMYFFTPTDGIGVAYTEVARGTKERHGTDPYAATRRAIVRAAAELGKSRAMEGK